jgi:carbonic anhydrase/acetyltransferase-like protein (isoleucine patch superfamily)
VIMKDVWLSLKPMGENSINSHWAGENMIKVFDGKTPTVDDRSFVHETAVVIGDVVIEEGANIWPYTVLRGDIERITIRKNVSVQDHTIVHTDPGFPVEIGEGSTIGHGCIIHGCRVGRESLIAMGATLLTGSSVGDQCIIGAGALLPEGRSVPDCSIAHGIPAKVIRDADERDKERIRKTSEAYQRLMAKYMKT